ncbi:hypothetical protein RRG08_001735 [Elysia crispata]|uniref:Uncharacterized protein n=1 Tax=Elysia crispata TaxID=231223 RepID=A0AAE1E0B5_9GAST|nr:hypothetical protein RRG08_001735 [Elysia crispata]
MHYTFVFLRSTEIYLKFQDPSSFHVVVSSEVVTQPSLLMVEYLPTDGALSLGSGMRCHCVVTPLLE